MRAVATNLESGLVKITYIEASGREHTVQAKIGHTVMETAVKNGVPGIVAECGGQRACATCRVYVDEAWRAKTGEAGKDELSMIEFSGETEPSARLSCQIKVVEGLDGLVVRMPQSQYR
jgi:ferredoxin, 2Fe-2S